MTDLQDRYDLMYKKGKYKIRDDSMTDDNVVKARTEYYIGKEKALLKIMKCSKCGFHGWIDAEDFIKVGTDARSKRETVQCPSCKAKFYAYELKTEFRFPIEERLKVPSLDGNMLESIFNMNKKFTDAVRDEEKPREDLIENVLGKAIGHVADECTEDYRKRAELAIKDTRMLRNAVAIQAEAAEYMDEMPWKWWGRGKHTLNKKKAGMELIDLLHFMMIAFDDLGYSAKDIYKLYCEKQLENRMRFIEKKGWDKANR